MPFDPVTAQWAKNRAIAYTDKAVEALAGGLKYKGSVDNWDALPITNNELGHMYTTADTGHEWVWPIKESSGPRTAWLDLSKDLENYYTKIEVNALLAAVKNDLDTRKLNVLPKVDDPTDPGYGWEYHIPYRFDVSLDAEKANIDLHTLTLDNKVTKMVFNKQVPSATQSTAGLLSATDKIKVDNAQPKLTAGTNITINEDNVISGATFDGKTIIKGADNTYQTAIGGWKEDAPEPTTDLFIDTKGDGTPTYFGPSSSSIKYDVGWDYNPTISSLVRSSTATINAKFTVLGTIFNGRVTLTKSPSIPANWESDYLTIGGNLYKIKIGDGWVGVGNGGISLIGNPSLDLSTSTMESCALVTGPASVVYHPIDNKFLDLDNSLSVGNDNKLKVDTSVIQSKLTAGDNITIDSNNVISAVLKKNAYNYIKQVSDYLFEVQYSTENIDYDYANKYFKTTSDFSKSFACTGVIKNGRALRQLDWYYDDNVEFIVRRPADIEKNIHASIGVASSIKDLTKSFVESNAFSEKYKIVPFIMTDGINDAGLYIQSNVVPALPNGFNINPGATKECCITMALRYMLDYCTSFAEVEDFFNTVHIYATDKVEYGYHFLVAKDNDWRVIELTETGHITVSQGTDTNQMPNGIITNFRTTGLRFWNGVVDWSSIEDYGIGVERYDIATKVFLLQDKSLEDLRNELKYTKLYTNTSNLWYTEFSGQEDAGGTKLTVMDAVNDPDKFEPLFTKERQNFNTRSRKDGKGTWQTTHSAIYDLDTKKFNITIQERNDIVFEFSLDSKDSDSIAFQLFPTSWVTSGTLHQVVDSILSQPKYNKSGMAYVGMISGECVPTGKSSESCTIIFTEDNVAVISVSDYNTKPYHWEYNTSSRLVNDYNWKKFSDVIANPTTSEEGTVLNKISVDNVVYKIKELTKVSELENDVPYLVQNDISLSNDWTTTITVGNLAAGTVLPKGTSVISILQKILIGDTPSYDSYIYYGTSNELPTSVEGLNKQLISRQTLLLDGIQKEITANNNYVVFALSKNLGLKAKSIEVTTFSVDLGCAPGWGSDTSGTGYDQPYETDTEYIYALPKASETYEYVVKFKSIL